MFNITPVVRSLIIINIVVFILQLLLKNLYTIQIGEESFSLGLTQLMSLWDLSTPLFKPYQFFTYMFAHSPTSYFHIIFNMLALSSFGPILENYLGDRKFLFFYLACGIGAGLIYGLTYFFVSPQAAGPMLGASGAIYGMLMAFGLMFPELEIMLLFPPIPLKAKYMVFVMGFITYAMDQSGRVAHLAHFAGAFVAFIIITYWRKTGR
jgi:membrane associated rhomboid family serine protease